VEINPAAPARAERDVEIAAPIEIVWDVLSNVQDWPRWNDEVDSTAITGPTAPGTEFRWKPGRGTIKSRIESAERPHHLAWTGHTFGISAIHVWRLEREEGRTRVKTEESMEGLPARLLRGTTQKNLDKSLDGWLRNLKAECERRS
jgi:uncharacterized protein YndB with AHSA1/START domain